MPFANATAGGGIHAKKNQNEKTKSTQDQAGSPRPRACQIRGARELTFTGIATELSTLHRRFRLLVLLGTSAFVQQNGGHPLPDSSRGQVACAWDHQCEARRSQTTRL